MTAPATPAPQPKPPWLKVRAPVGPGLDQVSTATERRQLHTVCVAARCPNRGACWEAHTATFMVMGEHCTRGCRFCHVKHAKSPPALDPDEPDRLASAIEELKLGYAVVTSVDRDDLPDGGARHFGACLRAVHVRVPTVPVEVLAPDFGGDAAALQMLLDAEPDVFGHNLETTEALTRTVRDGRAGYRRSLDVLGAARRLDADVVTKSGLMLGLGETDAEVMEALRHLREVGVDIVTLGQYLQPSAQQLPVRRYVHPARFDALGAEARAMGFSAVLAGPLVRSSYGAAALYAEGTAALLAAHAA